MNQKRPRVGAVEARGCSAAGRVTGHSAGGFACKEAPACVEAAEATESPVRETVREQG
jgi:hypothetical protein